jgi:hypothetical protein
MEEDTWSRDPSVRSMRRVFAGMETRQEQILRAAGISPFDGRLGQWRKTALRTFEERWAESAHSGANLTEADVTDLYVHSLVTVLERNCITVPSDLLPANPVADRLVERRR